MYMAIYRNLVVYIYMAICADLVVSIWQYIEIL